MKLKEKLAKEAIHDMHCTSFEMSAEIFIQLERKAFVLGFEKMRELAALEAKENFWDAGAAEPSLKLLGEDEVE